LQLKDKFIEGKQHPLVVSKKYDKRLDEARIKEQFFIE
jgi:hypothetical protein